MNYTVLCRHNIDIWKVKLMSWKVKIFLYVTLLILRTHNLRKNTWNTNKYFTTICNS